MIRRSRISIRPNVRPANRSTASQETSQKNQHLCSQASELSETAPEQPEASTTYTEKLETETSCQDEVSQSRKQVLEPPWRKNIVNLSLSKQHHSSAISDMTNDELTSLSPPNRCKPSSHKNAISLKPISHKVGINKDETSHSAGSVQVKADCKALQRSKGQQSSTAVPRQCKVKQREDIHALQQPDIMCLNKENTNNPESNTEQGTTLKLTGQQLDPFLSMDSSKASEESQGTSSPEQGTTTTLEKSKFKQTKKDSTAMRPQGLSDPADRIRLGKAQKLRELLKQEIYKERSQKNLTEKMKRMQYATLKDHSKMTMRELIYYLPKTNPMKYQEKDQQTNEANICSPVPSQSSEEISTQHEQRIGGKEQAQEEDVANLSESESSEPLLVPQVKVAEDGSLIIDEESLTVEVLRNKGPNFSDDRDPIFERGSTTTYSSFRKGSYTKPWSSQETDMFFLAISMVGTDFSMIGSMFPHRARSEIKNKFKKEERANAWRIDKAFREKRRLDLDFFTELLGKILADEERRKMNKEKTSVGARVQQRRTKKKPRVRKPAKVASDTEDSTEEDPIGDSTEGEKENENYMNEHETAVGEKGRKSGEGHDFSPVIDRQTFDTEYNDVGIERPGKSTPADSSHSDGRDPEIGHTPLMCELQQRTSTKVPGRTSEKAQQNATIGDCVTVETKAASSQTPKRLKATSRARRNKRESVEVNELLDKSTRTLKRPQVPKEKSKEHMHSNDPPNTVSRSKKKQTGLVTIRATVSEEDMEVQDKQEPRILEDCYPTNPEDQNQVPAFVPLGLCSPSLENAVVEEAVQEDVIDFIAPENLEESEESYKEAAQTLLTIGNSAHMRPISASVSAGKEQTDEQVTGAITAPERPDVSSEPTVHGASFTEINAVEESTDLSQLVDAHCEEPIFIISLTEISPSFIETLPSDTESPLSHAELLLCNPEPLPSLTESLTSETKTLPCITDTLPLNVENLSSFSDVGSSSHISQSLTEPHNMVTDIVPSLQEPTASITDHLPSVTEPLSSIAKSSAMTAQLNTQEVLGGDMFVIDRRAAPGHFAGQLFADDLVPKEGEEKGNKNNQLECTTDNSPTNLTLEASAIPHGETDVQSDPPSRQSSAKCTQAKTTPVSKICKIDQPPLTGILLETSCVSLPKRGVRETQSSTLEEIGSFCDFAPKVSIAISSSDELQTASGVVSHLLIPNALVAVSEEQEGGDEKEKLDDHNHREDATFQPALPSSTTTHAFDKTDQSSAPNATMSPSVCCSTSSHHNDFKDNSEQELTSEDPSICPNISHSSLWETPQDDTRSVSHMIVPDALVPVSAKMEKKQKSKQGKCIKRVKPDNLDSDSSTNENATRSSRQLDSDGLIEEMSPPRKRKVLEGTRRAKLQVKPALPVRRISSQNASGENSALPLSSTQSFSTSHSGSAQTNSTPLPKSSSKPPSTVSAVVGEESLFVQPSNPPVTIHATTRPGRKPKGFLSFMSSKNVSGTTTTRPPQVKSTQSRTMLTVPRTISPETELATPCSSSNTTTCDTGNAVLVTPSSCNTHSWNPSESTESCIKHHSEEPTKISEYFLSNIFTEVEEQN